MLKTILYLQYTNPAAYPPLEYSARILAASGWRCVFFGIRPEHTKAFKLPEVDGIESEIIPSARRGWRMKLHYLSFIAKCWLRARRLRADWVYVSDSLATPAGWLLSMFGYRVVYHEHDSPNDDSPASLFDRVVLWFRRSLACRADLIVIPQQQRLEVFKERLSTHQPAHVVWNCPMKEDVAQLPRPARSPDEPLCIYFHGSVNLRMISEELIRAAIDIGTATTIRVVGYETIGSVGATQTLLKLSEHGKPMLSMDFRGPKSRHELSAQMEGMHIGWVCYEAPENELNLRFLAGASNKAFDYLAAGLPILVPNRDDWMELFVTPGYALSCDPSSAASIADALRQIRDNPVKAAAMGEAGRQRILAEWNYEHQFAPVKEAMERALS